MKDGGIGGLVRDGGGLGEVMANVLDAGGEVADDDYTAGRSLHGVRDYGDIEVIELGEGVQDEGVFDLKDCNEVGEEREKEIGLAIAPAIVVAILEPHTVGGLREMLGELAFIAEAGGFRATRTCKGDTGGSLLKGLGILKPSYDAVGGLHLTSFKGD